MPLVAWVVLDDGKMHGVSVEDGLADATSSVEEHPDFVKYEKASNEEGEN